VASPATFARALAAAHYLLPHCGLAPSLVALLDARLRTAALEGGARLGECATTVLFPGTAEERLSQLRGYLRSACYGAPTAGAEYQLLGARQMLPAPRPHLRLVRTGPEVSVGGLELPGEEGSDPGIWPRDEHPSSVGDEATAHEVPR
jgi:hypothetical protein